MVCLYVILALGQNFRVMCGRMWARDWVRSPACHGDLPFPSHGLLRREAVRMTREVTGVQ